MTQQSFAKSTKSAIILPDTRLDFRRVDLLSLGSFCVLREFPPK